MAFGSVRLVPGVNTEKTPSLNEAGVTASQLIRYKDSLIQKYGGWSPYFAIAVAPVPRDLHGWLDLTNVAHLGVGSTTALTVLTSGVSSVITPQIFKSDIAPKFSTSIGSTVIGVKDANIANVTTFDSVYLATPVSVGGIVLSAGAYAIATVTGTTTYTITAATAATGNVTDGGAVPTFTTVTNSATVKVTLNNHGVVAGQTVIFSVSTTGNAVTIFGNYAVLDVIDGNNFDIVAQNQANASSAFNMNAGNAEIIYYINLGPTLAGAGYGSGAYGSGAYGFGTSGGTAQLGTPITATDWTQDNWGEILLACPTGGGIYQFDPTAGYSNAGLVATAPPFNGGIFVSTQLQILVAWASTVNQAIGSIQDPLLVKWSDSGDYTVWTPLTTNQARSFRIPNGSRIVAGMAVQNQNLIWTDIDVWAMNYLGPPFVFGFNKIGSGAGAVSSHAVQALRGSVYWMGVDNFYVYNSGGVNVIPCPVWDFVFQNLNTASIANVRAMPNTPFNEVGWLFPSSASSSGECDSYVKMNITEPNEPWDFGSIGRSAWMDQTALGSPISATPQGNLFQQETTPDAAGAPLNASFTTSYFMISEGEDVAFVDQVLPDMKWGTYPGTGNATVSFTFNATMFPGDAPVMYGPYVLTQGTEYFNTRIRARQISITVQSSDLGSFWRLGRVRYRWSPMGRHP